MSILFGKKKKAPPPPRISDSIQQLREAQVMLEKREKHIENQMKDCRDQAKAKLRNKDKRGALYQIKRAKQMEAQINSLQNKRSTLDVQINALEGAATNSEVVKVMLLGQQALKSATASVDVEKVDNLMEEMNEAMAQHEEIDNALAQPIGPQIDEDELKADLEAMEQEMNDEELLTVSDLPQPVVRTRTRVEERREEKAQATTPTSSTLPPIPARTLVNVGGGTSTASSSRSAGGAGAASGKKPVVDDKEARELKELEAMMGM